MKHLLLIALFALASCSQKQEEVEPDYENMVMAGEEDDDWITDEERDRKVIAGDLPDPQEQVIIELSEETDTK